MRHSLAGLATLPIPHKWGGSAGPARTKASLSLSVEKIVLLDRILGEIKHLTSVLFPGVNEAVHGSADAVVGGGDRRFSKCPILPCSFDRLRPQRPANLEGTPAIGRTDQSPVTFLQPSKVAATPAGITLVVPTVAAQRKT
jgi:hypothetical protein